VGQRSVRPEEAVIADLFVSYSRRDSAFVGRLVKSVSDAGKEVWLDTEGIADTEVFPEAIKRAIEGSDAFVFVITPASVSSSYCETEVEYARSMQKRIVPVLREPVADSALPAEIRDRSWIPLDDDAKYGPALERLLSALDTDLEAAKAHTRWLVKALEWDGEGRDKSFLARGSELAAAEAWLASIPDDADPAPTRSQREYLLASRSASARRQRTYVVASLAVAVVAIGLVIFALISRSQAVSARARALSEKIGARSQALAAESQAQLPNDPEISLNLAIRAVRIRATPKSVFALRAALDASPLERGFPTIANPGTCGQNAGLTATISPDGSQVAEGACNGTIRWLDAATGRILSSRKIAAPVATLAYSPDGSALAAATDRGVFLFSPLPRARAVRLKGAPEAASVAFSPDGHTLAADDDGGVELWALPDLSHRALVRAPTEGGNIVFSRSGRLLIVGGEDASVHVYDVASGRLLHRISAPQSWSSWPEVVALSRNGRQLAVAYPVRAQDATSSVAIYSTTTWRRQSNLLTIPDVEISSLAFSPNGTRLAIGAEDGTAGVWSIPTSQQLVSYDGPTAAVSSMSFTPDGSSVLTASNDGVARMWRALGVEQSFLSVPLSGFAEQLAFDGKTIETVPFEKPVIYSNTISGGPGRKLTIVGAQAVILSADGRLALGLGPIGTRAPISIWDTRTGRIVRRLPSAAANLGQASEFSSDDGRVALDIGSNLSAARGAVLTIATGRMVTLQHASAACRSAPSSFAFSRDGARVAAADFCGYADVWDARTGVLLRQVNQQGEISAVDLSPDGARLLVASWDSRATIWDVGTGQRFVNLIGDTRGIEGAAFSPDGSLVATTSLDHTVRLWDARTGDVLRTLTFPDDQWPIVFNAQGSEFATAESNPEPGAPDVIRVFDTCPACRDPRGLLALAARRVTNQLTVLERTVIDAA
jgi:WD40 repeat protein